MSRCWQIQCLSVKIHFWVLHWCHLTSSTEQNKVRRCCPTPASLSPPPSPLASSLALGFKVPPHGRGVWLGRKTSIMAGESKENAQSPGFLFPPLLPYPDSHHGLVCPHSGVPSPLVSPFRKTKWFFFIRELILCSMALFLWTSHLSQRFGQTNSGQTRRWVHGLIYQEIDQIMEHHRSQHNEHETMWEWPEPNKGYPCLLSFLFLLLQKPWLWKFTCDQISYRNRWAYCLSWEKKWARCHGLQYHLLK